MWVFGTVFFILDFILLGLAQPAQALSPAAQAEAQAIREVATTIRQTEERSRNLKSQVDAILRNLERRGAQARGNVPGWERLLNDLRSEAARVREARAALRSDAIDRESGTREATTALRTLRDLDQRLRRLNEVIAGTAQSLDKLQSRMREPEPPRAETPAPAPQRVKPQTSKQPPLEKETKQVDLSGAWIEGSEEWQIKHNPQDGTIIILDPVKHLPGRYLEFKGSVKGATITASYQVTDPEVVNPQLPQKVREQDVARRPTWRLKLQLTEEGKLEGSREVNRLSWNKKTLKITQTRPELNKVMLLRKPLEVTRNETFLPQPSRPVASSPAQSRGILPLPERAKTGPRISDRDPSVNGVWKTATGKVALVQHRDQVRGFGLRFADGCAEEYTGRAVRGPNHAIVVRLKNTSNDPKCHGNFPPGIASKVVGKLSNDFEMTLAADGQQLSGQSVHDRVQFDPNGFRLLRIRKEDRWAVSWQRLPTSCVDPGAQKPPVQVRRQDTPTPPEEPPADDPAEIAQRRARERARDLRDMRRDIASLDTHFVTKYPGYRQHVQHLRDDLLQQYERMRGAAPADDVRVEAEYIASHMVYEWHYRRDELKWDGGLDENLARWAMMALEAISGGEGALDQYGVCSNWQAAFLDRFGELDPQPTYFIRLVLQAHPGSRFREHNSAGIAPIIPGDRASFREAEKLQRAILIDPWRSDGEWFHGPVIGDPYPWQVSTARGTVE